MHFRRSCEEAVEEEVLSDAYCNAIARPIPEEAPVIRMTSLLVEDSGNELDIFKKLAAKKVKFA
jgi:hypothetical protein